MSEFTFFYLKGKLYSSIVPYYLTTIAFHIEITPLADGDISKAQANIVELTEAPNSDSEEPKSTDSKDTTTGKSRCIILLFQIMQPTITICLCI